MEPVSVVLIAAAVWPYVKEQITGVLANELHTRIRQHGPELRARFQRHALPTDPVALAAQRALRDALLVFAAAVEATLGPSETTFGTMRRWVKSGARFEDPGDGLNRGAQGAWLRGLRKAVFDSAQLDLLAAPDDAALGGVLSGESDLTDALLADWVDAWIHARVGPVPQREGLCANLLNGGWALEPNGLERMTLLKAWKLKFRAELAAQPAAFNAFVVDHLTILQNGGGIRIDAEALIAHLDRDLQDLNTLVDRLDATTCRIEGATDQIEAAAASVHESAAALARGIGTDGAFKLLPPMAQHWIGRDGEVDELRRHLISDRAATDGAVTIAGIEGMGGSGKTSLAIAASYATAGHFTGGHLYFALGAHSGRPVGALTARRAWVQGFEANSLPESEALVEQVYRRHLSRAAGPVLVIIDDPTGEADVEALKPRAGDAVLITSRRQLSGYPVVRLESLSPGASQELLVLWATRLDGTEELPEIATLCAYLPIALEVAGRFLARRPSKPISDYLADLRANRLSALSRSNQQGAGLDVEAVLAYSISTLESVEAAALRSLAAMPTSFTRQLGISVGACSGDVLDALVEVGLLNFNGESQRFTLHDLMREVVLKSADAADLESARHRHAIAVTELLARSNEAYAGGGAGVIEAIRLYDSERNHIASAFDFLVSDHKHGEALARLVSSSARVRAIRQAHAERIRWEQAVIDTALRVGNLHALGFHSGNLGTAYAEIGDDDQAIRHFNVSLKIARQSGNWKIEANQLANLAGAHRRLGHLEEALRHIDQALTIRRTHFDRRGEAVELGNKGNILGQLGQPEEALRVHRESLAVCDELGDLPSLVHALGNVGANLFSLEGVDKALPFLERAINLAVTIGDRRNEGWLAGCLAQARIAQREFAEANGFVERALAISTEMSDPVGIATARAIHASIETAKQPPNLTGARTQLEVALEVAKDLRQPQLLCSIFSQLSDVSLRQNDLPSAEHFAEAASHCLEQYDKAGALKMRAFAAALARRPFAVDGRATGDL